MSSSDPAALYASREPIFPRRVRGRFRNLKWAIMAVTLGGYYVTPWLRWDRGPHLPDQAVLVDLAHRRFFFFMIEIWPHEFYFVAGLLIMAGLGLFLFTAAMGRVWCGYACPQTVWTDLFILVERWIEGDRNARLRLHRQGWNAQKIRLRAAKWSLWLLIGLGTGGAWIFYFTDAPTLMADLLRGQAHPAAYATMAILTATTFAFGGFAREQICIYACPWPRIQSAMMDEDTLTVAYRDWRGEPRGKLARRSAGARAADDATVHAFRAPDDTAATPAADVAFAPAAAPLLHVTPTDRQGSGDCIDCMACVNVCPMGIDIRDGQQMECITCALCIDACDDVMEKIGRPKGLVGYLALSDEAAERAGQPPKPPLAHLLRVRTLLYFTLWAGIGAALIAALLLRAPLEFTVAPVRNPLYVTLSDGSIRNTYELRLRNRQAEDRPFAVSVEAEGGTLAVALEGQAGNIVTVPADRTLSQRLYVTAPAGSDLATAGRSPLAILVEDPGGTSVRNDTVFNGRGN